MRTVRGWCIAGSMLAGLWMGCGGNPPGMPDVQGGDVQMPDGGGMDVQMPPTDGGTDVARTDAQPDRAPADVAPMPDVQVNPDPCAPSAVVDLTTIAPGADGTVHYLGNNNSSVDMAGLTAPRTCIANMANYAGFQVAMRYRMRTTAGLRVTAVADGTQPDLDTVLMLATACTAGGAPTACNDDTSMTEFRSTVVSPGGLAMGADVFIVLGTYSPPFMSNVQQGDFEVVITEVPPLAAGAVCTPMDICPGGSTCTLDAGSTTARHCRVDGSDRGACRAMDPRCDTALRCNAATPTGPGVCRMPVARGMACAPGDVCETGSTCIANAGSTTMGMCLGDGTTGGACRMAAPRCDTGLNCTAVLDTDPGLCRTTVTMAGAACDPTGRASSCMAPLACGPTSATAGACRATVMEGTAVNDMPGMPEGAVTATTVIAGTVSDGADVDCFGVTVPMGASLFIQTSDGAGACPDMLDTVVQVFNTTAPTVVVTEDDDGGPGVCSQLDGTTTGPLHAMAAGTYSVCVSNYMMMPGTAYDLTITVIPP